MIDLNGFRAVAALTKAVADPRVECVEGEGLDPGRVFIHLRPGFAFANNGNQPGTRTQSVGTAADVQAALRMIHRTL
jgi:hypothetical protein